MAMLLKEWVLGQAEKDGVGYGAILARLQRGKYPGLRLVRINQRRVFVLAPGEVWNRPEVKPPAPARMVNRAARRPLRQHCSGLAERSAGRGAGVDRWDEGWHQPVHGDSLERLERIAP